MSEEAEKIVDYIADKDFTKAGDAFLDAMDNKRNDAIDSHKVAIAQTMFNDELEDDDEDLFDGEDEDEDEDQYELDLEDEDDLEDDEDESH